ncbi:MAG: discoidin domain-containing protein [Tannerella sp.]|jgi:hypothetical protein|nr:discoidin domain-containing protein [Tannerella sp.]
MKYILLFLLSLIILISCSKENDRLQWALELAGENRTELEKVLEHYQNEPLKLKAAEFLISNMNGFYTSHGKSMDKYYRIMDSINKAPITMEVLDMRDFYDSIFERYKLNDLKRTSDLESIKSQYLIQRIDHAFEAWQTPWAKDLSFEDFCEYLLPYRIGTEVLENWEQDYKNYFQYAFDRVDYQTDSALFTICDSISGRYKTNSYFYPDNMPTIKPSFLKHMQVAPCRDFANMFVFIGRTFGIPVAIDYIPQWANHANGHEWSAVIHNGQSQDFMIGEKTPLNGHLKKFRNKYTKVFRKTFGIQPNSLAILAHGEKLPPAFRNPRIKDVTKEYIPVIDLPIEHLIQNKDKGKRVYIAVFNNEDWSPIAWGDIKNNKAVIHDIGYDAVYLPVYYINDEYVPAQYPVKVDKQAVIRYLIPDKDNLQTILLKRKYMEYRAWDFVEFIKGGKFQLADNKAFSNPKELFIPDTVGYNYQTFDMNDKQKYRYIRYIPQPHTGGNIAEIEVYDKNGIQINGDIIGTYTYTNDTVHTMTKVFDGNALSYAICDQTRNDQWVGLDLKEAVEISQILYLPRSDDNFIKDNELYELFYWDNKWISLGKQTGNKQIQTLTYDNAPSNALFLLRNLTKGKEERIFTYENNKQVWW